MTRILVSAAAFFIASYADAEDLLISMRYHNSSTAEQRYVLLVKNKILLANIEVEEFGEGGKQKIQPKSMFQYAELTEGNLSSLKKNLMDLGIFDWKKRYLPGSQQKLVDRGISMRMLCHAFWDIFVSHKGTSSSTRGSCATPENYDKFLESAKVAAFSEPITESLPAEKTGNFLLTLSYRESNQQQIFMLIKGSQLVFARYSLAGSQQRDDIESDHSSAMYYAELTGEELNKYLSRLIKLGFWELSHRYMGKEVMQKLEAGISPWKDCHENWDMWLLFKGGGGYHYGRCAEPENFHEFLRITEKLAIEKSSGLKKDMNNE